ncbi:S8 family serine peptidase [Candidatus Acetothermia bacterium]|jgi:subtilisin family serine protease|nr:S8 family serine peptidase [Candidatus Acetothermia bacterium]MCI2427808.1 S8 family serine peptidase [Candidatus Acetothermia bacterium]MCI2428326.1 S8 family serine peptidase [Candidatus Acetothermia bacterium]
MKIISVALLIVILSLPFSMAGEEGARRLHPYLRDILRRQDAYSLSLVEISDQIQVFCRQGMVLSPMTPSGMHATGGEKIGVLVKTRHPVWAPFFHGVPIGVRVGRIFTTKVTLAELLILALAPEVIYIEPSWRVTPQLADSLPIIGVDRLHRWSPPLLGDGVIVGFVDSGIDYMHLNFRYDNDGDGTEESSRILYILDQTTRRLSDNHMIEHDIAAGLGPGIGIVQTKDQLGHGTHVAGIAVGDGSASELGNIGVAPTAQIIAVKTTWFTADIIAGVKFIIERAEAHRLPVVVNLSLGGHQGPHDGTSLFERVISDLSMRAGRAIVVSAGNSAEDEIHVHALLREGEVFEFAFIPTAAEAQLSLWYPGASRFTVTIIAPDGIRTLIPPGMAKEIKNRFARIWIDNAATGPSPLNNDNEVFVDFMRILPGSKWRFVITATAGSGRFNSWLWSANMGRFSPSTSKFTIMEPGNAPGVITVGAFVTGAQWRSLAAEQDFSHEYPLGALASWSSRGPTRDGRLKPDIAAPGAWIASARSASADFPGWMILHDNKHAVMKGTSMAAPHVAGTVALIFSLNPRLSSEAIRNSLTQTAKSDLKTGITPNNEWGFGKLFAYAGVLVFIPPDEKIARERPRLYLSENPVQLRVIFSYVIPDGAQKVTLRIFNIAGRLVFAQSLDPMDGKFNWDLRNMEGVPLANGLYIVILITDRAKSDLYRLVIRR